MKKQIFVWLGIVLLVFSISINIVQSISGDVVKIGLPNDLLEINEFLGDVRDTITQTDISGLRSGTITTSQGTTDYTQKLFFNKTNEPITSGKVVFDEDEMGNVGDFLKFEKGDIMFQYKIEFTEGLKSTFLENSSAINVSDFNGKTINIIGEDFIIVNVSIYTLSNYIQLELINDVEYAIIKNGEIKNYIINETNYEIEAIVNDSTAQLKINGILSTNLIDGRTVYDNGLAIGVKDIVSEDNIKIYLGTKIIKLFDTNYNDSYFFQGVEINNENIEDARVRINATANGNNFKINKIEYRLFADSPEGTIYIEKGLGLREYLDEPEGMLSSLWDIMYNGLLEVENSSIIFNPFEDKRYYLEFTNVKDIFYNISLTDNSNEGNKGFNLGDDYNDLIICEADEVSNIAISEPFIDKDDFFVLTDEPFDEDSSTHILKFDELDLNNSIISFTDLGATEINITYETSGEGIGGYIYGKGNITIDDGVFNVFVLNETTDKYPIELPNATGEVILAIDLNGDNEVNNTKTPIVVKGGGILEFNGINCSNNSIIRSDRTNGYLDLSIRTLTSQFDEPLTSRDELLNISIISRENNKLGLSTPTTYQTDRSSSYLLHKLEENQNISLGMTNYGVFLEFFNEFDETEINFSDILEEGARDTYTINGEDYEIEALVITDNGSINFRINGTLTGRLYENDVYDISSDIQLKVNGIIFNGAGDITIDEVSFTITAIETIDNKSEKLAIQYPLSQIKANVSIKVEQLPEMTITNPQENSTITTYSTWLNVTTNQISKCTYAYNHSFQNRTINIIKKMSITNAKKHAQLLNGINNQTKITILCQDTIGHSNSRSININFSLPENKFNNNQINLGNITNNSINYSNPKIRISIGVNETILDALIEITSSDNISFYNQKLEHGVLRYYDFNIYDSNFAEKITNITFRIDYNDSELSSNGLTENYLGVYWYNESSEEWVLLNKNMDWVLDITFNTEENYIEVTVTHFSSYGFGGISYCGDGTCDSDESCGSCSNDCGVCSSGGSSGGGGGGGSGSARSISLSFDNKGIANINGKEKSLYRFKIQNESHQFKIEKILSSTLKFKLKSKIIDGELSVGESASYDLNEDGNKDINVKLISTDALNREANITLKLIGEEKPKEETNNEDQSSDTKNIEDNESPTLELNEEIPTPINQSITPLGTDKKVSLKLIGIVAIVIILFVSILFIPKVRKKLNFTS